MYKPSQRKQNDKLDLRDLSKTAQRKCHFSCRKKEKIKPKKVGFRIHKTWFFKAIYYTGRSSKYCRSSQECYYVIYKDEGLRFSYSSSILRNCVRQFQIQSQKA